MLVVVVFSQKFQQIHLISTEMTQLDAIASKSSLAGTSFSQAIVQIQAVERAVRPLLQNQHTLLSLEVLDAAIMVHIQPSGPITKLDDKGAGVPKIQDGHAFQF